MPVIGKPLKFYSDEEHDLCFELKHQPYLVRACDKERKVSEMRRLKSQLAAVEMATQVERAHSG